jgi:DNA-binding transcriptional ArsR family regulator
MLKDVRILKVMADENRLRLLLLLRRRELFVCQLMAILGMSQPLVSRNLALLEREGLLDSRRQGKHIFYSLKKDLLPLAAAVLVALEAQWETGSSFASDRLGLELFYLRFQRGHGSCDMGMVKAFMEFREKNKIQGAPNGKSKQKSVH